jgi:hypothetical protein
MFDSRDLRPHGRRARSRQPGARPRLDGGGRSPSTRCAPGAPVGAGSTRLRHRRGTADAASISPCFRRRCRGAAPGRQPSAPARARGRARPRCSNWRRRLRRRDAWARPHDRCSGGAGTGAARHGGVFDRVGVHRRARTAKAPNEDAPGDCEDDDASGCGATRRAAAHDDGRQAEARRRRETCDGEKPCRVRPESHVVVGASGGGGAVPGDLLPERTCRIRRTPGERAARPAAGVPLPGRRLPLGRSSAPCFRGCEAGRRRDVHRQSRGGGSRERSLTPAASGEGGTAEAAPPSGGRQRAGNPWAAAPQIPPRMVLCTSVIGRWAERPTPKRGIVAPATWRASSPLGLASIPVASIAVRPNSGE